MKKSVFKSFYLFLVLFLLTIYSPLVVFGYGPGGGGGGGGGSSKPATVTAVNASLSLSNEQEGYLSRSYSGGLIIDLYAPKYSFNTNTKIDITPLEFAADEWVTSQGKKVWGGSVYKISVTDLNGAAITSFSNDLKITLTLSGISEVEIYSFSGDGSRSLISGEYSTSSPKFSFNTKKQLDIVFLIDQEKNEDIGGNADQNQGNSGDNSPSANDLSLGNIKDYIGLSGEVVNRLSLLEAGSIGDDDFSVSAIDQGIAEKITKNRKFSQKEFSRIKNFISLGTQTTKILGSGERGGVINSYYAAFGRLPSSDIEWQDLIKIANGRWPKESSVAAEENAKSEFRKIYKRAPNMTQANDNAAVTVVAYGLRPAQRNTESEKAGIRIFRNIYGHDPVSATDWDIVRAIAYSGAKR